MDKITSKSSIRPELQSVYFHPDRMVATDSFRLIEVKKAVGISEPRLLKVKGFKGRGAVSVADDDIVNDGGKLIQGERVDAAYPDYEQILAGLKDAPRFSMTVNAKLLSELLAEVDAQAHGDGNHKIRLDFFEKNKPLLITAEGEATVEVPSGYGGNFTETERRKVSVRALLSPIMG